MRQAGNVFVFLALVSFFFDIAGADQSALVWSTFLGGSDSELVQPVGGLDVDAAGNVYVAGYTASTDFPVTAGAFDTSYNGGSYDLFVAKLNALGSDLVYATYIGGSGDEGFIHICPSDIAIGEDGSAFVTGVTLSPDFPTTSQAFDTSHSSGSLDRDPFVLKLDPSGNTLEYATFLGGDGEDYSHGIAVDHMGHACIIGYTESPDFPTTSAAYDTILNQREVYVVKLSPTGGDLEFATFLGGQSIDTGWEILLDQAGDIYVCGSTFSSDFPATDGAFETEIQGGLDGFVVKLSADGTSLHYGTFLGGSGDDGILGLAIDGSGNAYLTGETNSADFPVTPGAFDITFNDQYPNDDCFVTKIDASGSFLLYSTYLGGDQGEEGHGIAVDSFGYAYVTGGTFSDDFPITSGAFDSTSRRDGDAFIVKLTPAGNDLEYATYFGDNGVDKGKGIAVDALGFLYLSGQTSSSGFPTVAGSFDTTFNGQSDIFVAKFNLSGTSVVPETPQPRHPHLDLLHPNYPNPFNASTEIRYQLPEDADVSMKVYNAAGQTIRTLIDARQPAGFHAAAWDGTDDDHRNVASGIYFCRLQAGGTAETIKMALVR